MNQSKIDIKQDAPEEEAVPEEEFEEEAPLTAQDLMSKIGVLETYVKKAGKRIEQLEKEVLREINVDKKELEKMKAGMKLYDVDKDGFSV